MDQLALVTVEITLLDANKKIVIGGPPNQAAAMQSKLAAAMNVPFRQGMLLELSLRNSDMRDIVFPIWAEFPNLSWNYADEVSALMIADGAAATYR